MEMNTYHFKVDGCLPVYHRAPDEKTARARVQQAWPRSKVELTAVNALSDHHTKGSQINCPTPERKNSVGAEPIRPVSHHCKPSNDYAEAITEAVANG